MVFVKSIFIESIGGNNRKYIKEKIILICDECGLEYVCKEDQKTRSKKTELHFCCIKCSYKSAANGKLRQKVTKAIIEKYDGHYVTTEAFKKQSEEKNLLNFGVSNVFSCDEIKNKIKNTNIEKYGRPTFAGSAQHIESCDFKEIAEKAWKTKIKNGSCSLSKPEEKMYGYLVDLFGKDNVKRQEKMLSQWVDFYIKDANLYIQVDGVYWHGLNRGIDKIKKGETSQDKKIYKQIIRDEKLNFYCKDNNIKIIRFTDIDINTKTKEEIHAAIRSYL